MPLLLRRSAPSPSIDELAFAVPAAPLSASAASAMNSTGNIGTLRSSAGSETQFAQLQRCSTHARISMMRRRSTASNDTEMFCTHESCVVEDCSDPQHVHHLQQRDSCGDDEDHESVSRSSKRSTQDDQQDDEDTSTSEWGYGSEAGRASSAPSCSCSCRDDDASSTVLIEDKQLAVVDMELRDLRKTFAKKLYTRLSKMSQTFGRKRGGSNPQLTAS